MKREWSWEQIGPLDPNTVEWVLGNKRRKENFIGVAGFNDVFTWDGKTLRQENQNLFDIVIGTDGTPGAMMRKKSVSLKQAPDFA